MFDLFKRRKSASDDLSAIVRSAEAEVAARWLRFVAEIHFKDDVPLVDRIDSFTHPIQEFLFTRYPVMRNAPAGLFWLMLFNAIASSKTHTQAQLNEAIAALKGRHASST